MAQQKDVKSINKAVKILEAFLEGNGKMSFSEIVRRTHLPKATAHRIIATLKNNLLIEENKENKYSLGIGLFKLGNFTLRNFKLRNIALPLMEKLQKKSGETVFLTVLQEDIIVYIGVIEPSSQLRCTVDIGQTAPAYCTAMGKVLLSYQPEENITKILKKKREKLTKNTITQAGKLREELLRTRERGYAINNAEHEDNVRGVAVPIRDSQGRVISSLAVGGPTARVAEAQLPALALQARETASEISKRLGFSETGTR